MIWSKVTLDFSEAVKLGALGRIFTGGTSASSEI